MFFDAEFLNRLFIELFLLLLLELFLFLLFSFLLTITEEGVDMSTLFV